MNQNQRKYAATRLYAIYTEKVKAIQEAFESEPINELKAVPAEETPSYADALKTVLGFPTGKNLTYKSKTEITSMIGKIGKKETRKHTFGGSYTFEAPAPNLQDLFVPLNLLEINQATATNKLIETKRKKYVEKPIKALDKEYQSLLDTINLGEESEALAAIQKFETFTVKHEELKNLVTAQVAGSKIDSPAEKA